MSYTIQFYHGGTNQNYSSRCAEHARNKTQNKQSQKEATSAPILPKKDASQVPEQPWNYKKPLKRGTSSCTFTKFGTSSNVQRNFFPPTKKLL